MDRNTVFNTGNGLICINFAGNTIRIATASVTENTRKIHIFAFDIDKVDAEKLSCISELWREKGIICIVHCFSHEEKMKLKKRFKGVQKDKWFHFNKQNGQFMQKFSLEKEITVARNQVVISINRKTGIEKQKILYGEI